MKLNKTKFMIIEEQSLRWNLKGYKIMQAVKLSMPQVKKKPQRSVKE